MITVPKGAQLWVCKDHIKTTHLWLYPELECSACVDECDGDGAEQSAYYCDYIRTHYSQWWQADAVPIYWSVIGDRDGFGSETAPCAANLLRTYYYPPRHATTGETINWFKLPVVNQHFPDFAAALGWLPTPFQATAPLRSILEGNNKEKPTERKQQ
jgi:hypothetical protein